MTMQRVLQFMRRFLDAEYEALIVMVAESQEDAFRQKKQAAERFLAPGVRSELQRPSLPDDEWFARGRARVAAGQLVPRTLFQIKAYDHPTIGALHRAYVSLTTRPRGERSVYFANFYVAPVDDRLQIVSRYNIDRLPDPERPRFEDLSLWWVWHSGVQLTTLGRLVDVRKLQAPDDPVSLAEYEAE